MASYICKIEDFGDFIDRMKKLAAGTGAKFDCKEPLILINKLSEGEYGCIKWYFYCDNQKGNTIRLYDSEFHDKFSKKLYVEPKDYVILRGHDLGKEHETLKQKIRELFESIEKPPPGIRAKYPKACLSYFEKRNNGGMKPKDRCWRYSRNPDDKNDKKWYVLAFVNGKGRCSLTRFEAASGRFLSMDTKKGDFQDNFADWLNPVSFPLRFSHTIKLVKARKEGLTEDELCEIKKQVIELATSALLGTLDC